MWHIHVKDALTDVWFTASSWSEVVHTLDTLDANIQGDVTITWQNEAARVDLASRTLTSVS